MQNLFNTKMEKNYTCRRFWTFILWIGEQFEQLYNIRKVKLDNIQVTFFLLLWKYISINPYVLWQNRKICQVQFISDVVFHAVYGP